MGLIDKIISWIDGIFGLFGPFAGWFVIALVLVAFGNIGKVFSLKIKV